MPYTVLRGEFVIRYPDNPRQGPEPDGDTVKFQPATPALVETLPRPSGTSPDLNSRGISVRLEAIDALETHFAETHQEILGAEDARGALLAGLGFTNITYFPDLPNKVQSADQDMLPGYVLSNGIDAHGRLIGFVYAGIPATADGARIFLVNDGVDSSVNAQLLQAGLVYPAFYGTLPATLRAHLATRSRAARETRSGIWVRSIADPDGPATITDLASLEAKVMWPKLFRRIVPYLAAGHSTFDAFDAWLREDPVGRDDTIFRLTLDPPEPGNLHDIITGAGQRIQLTSWPEDFIIAPDPAPPGTSTGPRTFTAGDLVIVAALPDPIGADRNAETVSIANPTAAAIDLHGWKITDTANRSQDLTGTAGAGDIIRITLTGGMSLGNRGGSITLTDPHGATIDHANYAETHVKAGQTILFGRTP